MYSFKLLAMSCLAAASLLAAGNPFLGTWKLEPGKSTFEPGQEIKDLTVTMTLEGDKIRRIAVGAYANGKPFDQGGPDGVAFAWDGKPHMVSEAPAKVIITCTPVHHASMRVTVQMNGKLAAKRVAQVSADGNVFTDSGENYDPQGKAHQETLVFAKQ